LNPYKVKQLLIAFWGKKLKNEKSSGKLNWHPAFLQAIQHELYDY